VALIFGLPAPRSLPTTHPTIVVHTARVQSRSSKAVGTLEVFHLTHSPALHHRR